ncbi:Bug family tripartite tricarboxylate transporter substrate binding protein [Halalkalibacterium ligniniphilum]|uniref:Bug family tripartite tricarboxylate transporter substrate binding protein n=1 Tax=Halalkalibacterium ligniniphilum TaxID=1134413 RepID=UPI00034AD82E|nr:tripartite tricarboxylate transporter substrate-binding protein [Halalkalibacterium ligniniphilum]
MVTLKKNWILFLTIVLSLSLVLAACSSDGGPSGTSGAADTGNGESEAVEFTKGEDVAAFYEGQRLRLIVPYDPGGGYDEYARLLMPYLEKYTGARIEIANLPGAGGMRGANELWRAPNDGLTIGHINGSALVMNDLAGIEGAEYNIEEFSYLGRVVTDLRVLTMQVDGDFETADDLFTIDRTIRLGATGLGGSTYVDAVVVGEAFGFDQEVMHGFDSSGVIEQAMLRGDVDGMWGSYGSAYDRIEEGLVKVVLQSGHERSEALPDIPTIFEMVDKYETSDMGLELLNVLEELTAVGRPIVAPPGVPEERLEFLREAFEQAMNDPELIERAESATRELHYLSGQEMEDVVNSATEMSDEVRDILIAAVRGQL